MTVRIEKDNIVRGRPVYQKLSPRSFTAVGHVTEQGSPVVMRLSRSNTAFIHLLGLVSSGSDNSSSSNYCDESNGTKIHEDRTACSRSCGVTQNVVFYSVLVLMCRGFSEISP